jgi:hypothetical protein
MIREWNVVSPEARIAMAQTDGGAFVYQSFGFRTE